ncbi:hypothetical protein MEO41_28445, partial [Dolichospermum sp. ST_sed4]|nr:hypothetical protein [Dolichospermum sp. ST_sed4]
MFCVSQTADTSQCTTTGSGCYGLIMANIDQVNYINYKGCYSSTECGVTWSGASTSVPGALSLDNGAANTNAIIAAFPSDTTNNNAAKVARSYAGGGYNDWYLPSKNEL